MFAELVGRDRELAQALALLDRAIAGSTGLVVCVGEPGIGKSRLAEEVHRAAEERSMGVAWGRASPDRGVPPYWPWREVIAGLSTERFTSAAEVAELGPAPAEPSFEERIRLFDAVRRRLSEAAGARPTLVVIDDLDSADEPSQRLAHYLGQSLRTVPILFFVTCRSTSGPLALLAQEPNVTHVELTGLSPAEAARQVASIIGRDATEDEVACLHSASAGNPFFLAELARPMARGAPASVDPPRSVLDAVDRRVGELTPECRHTLQAAAVLGPAFAVSVLSAMTGVPIAQCLTHLDEGARASMVRAGDQPGRHRFVHELVRQAIVAGLDASQRLSWHRAAAVALEGLGGADGESLLFELALHWSEAGVDGDTSRAAAWQQRAGQVAMRQHAYEDARKWFTRALTLGATVLDARAHAELLLLLASSEALSADIPGALRTCQRLIDVADRIGVPELAGRAALIVEPTFEHDVDVVVRELCEQALALLGLESPAMRAKVLSAYAVVCDHLADIAAAERAVTESLALADECGDVAAMEASLIGHHMVRSGPDGLEERAANADRMWDLGLLNGSAAACLAAAEWRFDVAGERGDLAGAARQLDVIARWAARVGGPISIWRELRCRAMIAQARGRLAEANTYADAALATMAPLGLPQAFLLWSGFAAAAAHHTGYRTETLRALGVTEEDAAPDGRPAQGVIPILAPAGVLVQVGRRREAAQLYRRLGQTTEWRESPHAQLFTWAIGIATAVALHADEDVRTLRSRLAGFRGHHLVNGRYAMAYLGPAELWLGVAAAHLGLLDDAVEDLEVALKACSANGADGFRAEAQHHLAAVLVQRSAPGDVARARGLAVEALRCAEDLGLPPLREACVELLAGIQAGSSVGLTRRECEVASLVAEGLSNRGIAERLFLSERTAQNHVQHILDKLDLRNRSQVAVWARENLTTE